MRLNPPDITILLQAMERSFGPFDMERVLLERTGLRLFNITAAFKRFSDQVVDIHQHFDHRNATEQLIATLRDARPSVPEFAILADKAGFAQVPNRQSLEVFARQSGPAYQDVTVFRGDLGKREAAVCRVETNVSFGTGFLVAPDLVLTNFHVVEKALNADTQLRSGVSCLFDHKLGVDGYVTPGTRAAATLVVAASPYAEEDLDPTLEVTRMDRLDYAVLKLERTIGHEPIVLGGDNRGFVAIGDPPPAAQLMEGLLVLQHPEAKPMKIDIGTVTQSGNARLRHNVNTEGGSSGSPVFNSALRVIGLHHAGYDWPSTGHPFNQAIPLALIAADLRARGVGV